jgi:YD repeat-containing protein
MKRFKVRIRIRPRSIASCNSRTKLKFFTPLLLFALPLLSAQVASAQVGLSNAHPNLARGSANARTVETYPWDSVNLFNGNLNISVPLGINYPLAGGFGYQFSLTYNSNVWDFEQPSSITTAMPLKNSNAGFGWDVSFGRLIPPAVGGTQAGRWVYVSPDGSLHPFYSTLHYDLSESDSADASLYTRDGTYYRMKIIASDQVLVEAPDGAQSLFNLSNGEWKLSQIGDRFNNRLWFTYSTPNLWTLTDNHGRIHRVYFKGDPAGYYPAVVDRIEVAAFNGTTAAYTFAYVTASIPRPGIDNDPATSATVNLPLLASVTHPDGSRHAFAYEPAAADSSGRLASMQLPTMGKIEWTYQTYRYTTGSNPTSLSPVFRQNTGVATRRLVNISGGVDGTWTYAPSLQPSGSEEREMTNTVKTPLGDKTVYYFSVNTLANGPEWARSDYGLPFTKNQFDRPRNATNNVALASNGAIATASSTVNASYPASAAINGDRTGVNWNNAGGWNDATTNFFPDWLEIAFGANKTIDRINVFTLQDDYRNAVEPPADMTFSQFGIQDFDVQYWNGSGWATVQGGNVVGNDKVWRQFMFPPTTTSKIRVVVNKANMSSRIVEVEAFESALPAGTRFLCKQVFDCDTAGSNCQLVRSTYVRYEQDQPTDPVSPEVASVNRREASNRVVYHDDVENGAARFADSDKTNFDGLGHYRQVTTNGNFASGDVRTTFQNYDAATGSYPSAGYAMPPPGGPWVLNTVSQQKVTEGQSMQVIEFCYDRTNGFLKRMRQWSATFATGAASPKDAVTVYTPDAYGQVAVEQYYGGDIQPIGTGELCALALPADQYRIQHTYQYGVKSTSQFYTSAGAPFGPKLVDLDIDRNTGLAAASRDSAGIATGYDYDALGRQTWVKPQSGHGSWRQFNYVAAVPTDYARKFIYDKANGGGGVLTYNADVYDSFGRVWWQQTAVPGSYPSRYAAYNPMGWLTHQSEFSNDAPKYTMYSDYDPFGRPRLIIPPDGTQHNTVMEYAGVRSVKTTEQIGVAYYQSTGQVLEAPRSTIDIYDRQGRLWQHGTPLRGSNTASGNVTVYSYDVAGHLVESRLNGNLSGNRLNYDGRGFLVLTQNIYGTDTFYQDFDALGKARTQRHNLTNLAYVFDRAGRLTRVHDALDAAKVWKEFVYADSNGANDWRAGKLWSTKRYNYIPPYTSPAVITETNTYGGKGGRLSRYEIELSDGVHATEKFAQTYTYDELGYVNETGYPNSVAAGSGNMNRTRTVTDNYVVGYLTSVRGSLNGQAENWATSINYHPNGIISNLAHGNGVTDNIAKDPNDLARVASISTTGVRQSNWQGDQNFYSGDFQYDGSGSLVRIGSQFFLQPANQQPGTSLPPPVYSTHCQNAWTDPFKLTYGAVSDGSCQPMTYYYYTADDRLFKIEDRSADRKTWYFTNLYGRTITEYATTNVLTNWLFTRDYIYSKGSVIGIFDSLSAAPFSRAFHFTRGYGAAGIVTDKDGYRTQLDQ